MGGLVLMATVIVAFIMYSTNIKNNIEEAEKSTIVKQYIENAKNSQEQILLKGEPTIFTNFIVDNITKNEQKVLNRAYYILTNNKNVNNNIVNNVNELCNTISGEDNSVTPQECKTILESNYNFLTLDSSGVNINIGEEYKDSLSHLNTLQQSGYEINGVNAKLSNNSLSQFDSNLKQIETMASGDSAYVQNNSMKFSLTQAQTSAANLINGEASATKSEVMNIISSSLTNSNSLASNIDITNVSNDKNKIIQKSLEEKDAQGNIKTLVKNQNLNINLTDDTVNTNNLDMVSSFKGNAVSKKEAFSFYK